MTNQLYIEDRNHFLMNHDLYQSRSEQQIIQLMQVQPISDILQHLIFIMKNMQGYQQHMKSFMEQYSYIEDKKNFMIIDSLIMFCTSEKYGEIQQQAAFQLLKQARQFYYNPIIIVNNGSSIKDNEILQLIERLIHSYQTKYIQAVLSIIITQLSSQWIFTKPLIDDVNTRQNSKYLSGIYSTLLIFKDSQNQSTQQINYISFSLSKVILPILKKITNEDPTEQLIYVCIKCLSKIIRYKINIQIRRLSNQLMPLLINVLQSYVPLYHMNISQIDTKGSPQFFYFHSKKWSLKIILKILQGDAVRVSDLFGNGRFSENWFFPNKQISEQWFLTYGNSIVASLVQLFNIQLPENYRKLQLKCIQRLALNRSDALLPFRQILNYQLIPNFIQYPRQYSQMMIKDPHYFYKSQAFLSDSDSITHIAINTWESIALKGRGYNRQSIVGEVFIESLNYIFYLLDSMRIQDQQKAYSLLGNITLQNYEIYHINHLRSIILDKYFIKSFSWDSIVLKNLVLSYFIKKGDDLIVDTSIIQPIITNLLCNIEKIDIPYIQFKCFVFICILGSKKKYLEVIQRNMQLILNIFLHLVDICPFESLFCTFNQLIKRNYKQLPRYSTKISTKLIQCIKTITSSSQQQQRGQSQIISDAILQILAKCSLILPTYQDHILFAKDLVKLLVYLNLSNRGMNVIHNYLQKSYKLCINSKIFYPNLWQDLINYLQNLQQRIVYLQRRREIVKIILESWVQENEIAQMYLKISFCFVRTMKSQSPRRLLDSIFNFFQIISIQRVEKGIQILSCQLYGLILLYNQSYFLQKFQAWIIIAAILKTLNNQISNLQYKKINTYILIISNMLKLENKPNNLMPLFQQVFLKLFGLIQIKMDRISNGRTQRQDYDSQSQSLQDQQLSKTEEDYKALSDFIRMIKYIEQNDKKFYQKLGPACLRLIRRLEFQIARISR